MVRMTLNLDTLRKWYATHQKEILSEFFSFLKIASVSTDPAYAGEVRKGAEWVRAKLEKIGFQVEVWQTVGHPVVFASHVVDRSRPTVLLYHHYDVQPVDPIDKWVSPPFEPEVRGDAVYARGASDNKGQCFATLTALQALFELCGKMNVNIKVFVEGEEESGSRGALQMVREKREALQADYLLIVDMGIPAAETPAITLSLRGIVAMEVRCRNSRVDLHSGMLGGIALNPNRVLTTLLAKLWDAQGTVAIPGFYDRVKDVPRESLRTVDQTLDEAHLKKQFGLRAFQVEGNYSLWESNCIRPTLEINGISGGYTGVGFKTVIPAEAIAKLSCRLVPDQDPAEIAACLTTFLKAHVPAGIELEVTHDHGGRPVRTLPSTKLAQLCTGAYAEVFGKPCQKMFCGASVPLVADLAEAVGGEVAMIGVGLDSDDIHAPNEHFTLHQLQMGFLTLGKILGELAKC